VSHPNSPSGPGFFDRFVIVRADVGVSHASPISLTPGKTWRVSFEKDFFENRKILRKDWGNT
jgi:hypothetical protein